MLRLNVAIYFLSVPLMVLSTRAASQDASQLPGTGNMSLTHPMDSETKGRDSGEYDRRALRFELHRGTIRILQGNDGAVVGRTQWFRPFDLASIVSSSERARSEAQDFNRNRTPGMWALTLGIVATAADAILVRTQGSPNFVTSAVSIGGLILIVSGIERLDRASEALSRSLWWYNRDLKK